MRRVILVGTLIAAVLPISLRAEGSNSLRSPNVSGNALFLYRHSNFGAADRATRRNGIDLREAELAFYSDVDPYSRLTMILSVHPEYDNTSGTVEQSWVVEPEELYAETDQIPSLTLRLGKFKAALGKHNQMHTHAYPFVDAPLINELLLGEEGLSDVGVSAAILLPARWFSELTVQALRGEGENAEFHSPSPNDAVGLVHLKNLWDLSEDATLEAGLSYAAGNNSYGGNTTLSGLDVSYKWRPVAGGKYKAWIVAGEYLNRQVGNPQINSTQVGEGWNIWLQNQFAQRWTAGVRYDYVRQSETGNKLTFGLNFSATEFSSYRFEYSYQEGIEGPFGGAIDRTLYLQANYTIGAHPAHSY